MKSYFFKTALIGGLLAVGVSANATITLQPPGDDQTNTTSNLTTLEQINTAFGTTYTDLTLVFKANDAGGAEEGSLTGSYNYTNIQTGAGDDGATGGDIVHVAGTAAASCPTCILIVKDGNANPAQYLFDLGSWDGTETLALRNFWAGVQGAISNVAIWAGTTTRVPEPGSLALLGAGLLGLGLARRRRSA
jgi:hypothetical protein